MVMEEDLVEGRVVALAEETEVQVEQSEAQAALWVEQSVVLPAQLHHALLSLPAHPFHHQLLRAHPDLRMHPLFLNSPLIHDHYNLLHHLYPQYPPLRYLPSLLPSLWDLPHLLSPPFPLFLLHLLNPPDHLFSLDPLYLHLPRVRLAPVPSPHLPLPPPNPPPVHKTRRILSPALNPPLLPLLFPLLPAPPRIVVLQEPATSAHLAVLPRISVH